MKAATAVPAGLLHSAAGADTQQHLHSANHKLHAVPRYQLNTYGRRAFSVTGPIV